MEAIASIFYAIIGFENAISSDGEPVFCYSGMCCETILSPIRKILRSR